MAPLNGAGVCGAVLADLGLPLAMLRGFALLARTGGLLGQIAEEQRTPIANDIYMHVDRNAVWREPDGKERHHIGPAPDEFGLPRMFFAGEVNLSAHILRSGLDAGFDLAFSNELRIDHSVTCPMITLRPECDLPIVPVYTNIFAPPLPQPKRYVQFGQAIRDLVASWPSDQRVAFLTLTLFIAMFERDHAEPLAFQLDYAQRLAHFKLPYPDIAT